jgi:hypothetical protein
MMLPPNAVAIASLAGKTILVVTKRLATMRAGSFAIITKHESFEFTIPSAVEKCHPKENCV